MHNDTYNLLFTRNGSTMIKLDIDIRNGGLKLDDEFLVDFGIEKDDILLAHEMRFEFYYII